MAETAVEVMPRDVWLMLIGPARWFLLSVRMAQTIRRRNDRDQAPLIRSPQRARASATRFASGFVTATAPHILEMRGVAELFVLVPVFLAALMAARALAQAGYNPLGAARERLTRQAEC